ncbi:nSTAND1 domain-containing NTPase [Acanthopleuribacter pedis]|uniref:Protein kinase n=1 Tax=Acanthopleuribacter pedis TaxID=442870 RepID=A0A8J7QPZ8_9BACT|nr:protein kinase [Acanthopleuribacter pedis]MBO1322865.1 protein kinase [Acanthopleuribacter pedis]
MSGADADKPPVIGSRVGPYRIVRELGSGGMGAVYLAEREDAVVHMQVCVKLLHAHRTTPDLLNRFQQERQLMANLNHPHIATLYDAGQTEDGRPYIIMEYIEGQHIDTWYRETRPEPPVLLETFHKVAEAVGAAHAQGVIHRDIKPQNILVTRQNIPKLLDFGIAQLADTPAAATLQTHCFGPMTPAYAAPEQLQGLAVYPTTDIYALGLVLLQLLSGKTPYELGCSPREAVDHLAQGRWRQAMPPNGKDALDMIAQALFPTVDSGAAGPSQTHTAGTSETETKAEKTDSSDHAFPAALAYVLRRCLAEWGHARFVDGNNLATALKQLQTQLLQKGGLATTPGKTLDAVFWFHERDAQSVARIAEQLRTRGVARIWPSPKESAGGTPSNRAWENAMAKSQACVICLGPGSHTPWQAQPALRDALAFYAHELFLVPLLLPGAAFPRKQSALPGFLRDRQWLRAGDAGERNLDALVAAVRGGKPAPTAARQPTGICPFRGLEVFREEDQHLFFGREAVSQQVFEHLVAQGFSAVIGPSGSGKSSIIQAGVVPLLRETDTTIMMTAPGASPLAEIAFGFSAHLRDLGKSAPVEPLHQRLCASPEALFSITREILTASGNSRFCLVIDQFEELFTLAAPEETGAFCEALCQAVAKPEGGFQVLLTMRADFLGKCAAYPDLNKYVVEHLIQVETMHRNDLIRAIEEPARLGGLQLETGLLDHMLDDLTGASGELPLLEHALLELFERHEDGLLTWSAYQAVGGIAGALARRAEQAFAALSPEAQQGLRKMFTLCLVHPGEGAEDTRRRATRAELIAVGGAGAETLIDRWTAARLLSGTHDATRDITLVDVAHEALIRNWRRIGEWMTEDRETARLFNRLRHAAAEWDAVGRDDDHLWRGGLLLPMRDLATSHGDLFGPIETAFVKRSIQAEAQENQWKRLRWMMMSGLGLASTVLAVFAFWLFFKSQRSEGDALAAKERAEWAHTQALMEKQRAEEQTLTSHYHLALAFNEKAGIALEDGHTMEAWLYTLAALSQEIPSHQTLPEPVGRFGDPRLATNNPLLWTTPAAPPLAKVAADSAGRDLALADRQGFIRLMDRRTGRQRALLDQAHHGISVLAFSPGGTTLVAGSPHGELYFWHPDQNGIHLFPGRHEGRVTAQAFTEDGRRLASGDELGTILIHNVGENILQRRYQAQGPINLLLITKSSLFFTNKAGELLHLNQNAPETQEPKGLKRPGSAPVVGLARNKHGGVLSVDKHGGLAHYSAAGTLQKTQQLNSSVTSTVTTGSGRLMAMGDGPAGPWLWDGRTGETRPVTVPHGLQPAAWRDNTLIGLDEDGRLHQIDADGKEVTTLIGFTDTVWGVAISPDGATLAGASWDKTLILFDLKSGRQRAILRGHSSHVVGVAFSPDGTRLASASADHTVRLWDITTPGSQTAPVVLQGHTGAVIEVAFSPDGTRLASASRDHTIRLWDPRVPAERAARGVLRGHQGPVVGLAYAVDGTRLASASADHSVRLWDAAAPAEHAARQVFKGHTSSVVDVAFAPDGHRMASVSADQTIRLWDTRRRAERALQAVFEGHHAGVYGIAFSPDGSLLASASADQTIRLWDPDAPAAQAAVAVLYGHGGSVYEVAFSPDGARLASASADHTLRLWDTAPTAVRNEQAVLGGHEASVYGTAFSPRGNQLASGSADQKIRIWDLDLAADTRPRLLRGHKAEVWGLEFSPDGTRLASGSDDTTVRVWDLTTPPEHGKHQVLRGHTSSVYTVAFSPDGTQLASASEDHTVRIWNLAEPEAAAKVLRGHSDSVAGVAYSPSGRLLATASSDHTVQLWDVAALAGTNEPSVLRGHSASVYGVAFSPDGTRLASASADQTIRLWDPTATPDRAERAVLRGHTANAYGVAFSPNGHMLASTSADFTVRLWDAHSGRLLAVLAGHQGEVNLDPSFNADGTLLASPSDDQTVRLWRLDRLRLPPPDVPPHQWYGDLLSRALYQTGMRLDGFQLVPQPRLRLQGVARPLQPSSWEHLDRPYPPGVDRVRWLLEGETNPEDRRPESN